MDTKRKGLLATWGLLTLVIFFFWDILWILADFDDFRKGLSGRYYVVLADFCYCMVFAFTSLVLSHWSLSRMRPRGVGDRGRLLRVVIFVLICNLGVAWLCEALADAFYPLDMSGDDDVWCSAYFFGLLATLVSLILLAQYYTDLIVRHERDKMALQKKCLKLQLNPHFVFNSLSTLAGMIEVAPSRAEDYVVRLSRIYRYMLGHIDRDLVTMAEARDFAREYVDLLNLRCDGHIVLHIEGDYDRQDCILALSLQLLIENAVKHNQPQDGETLRVHIDRHGDMLRIRNNRLGLPHCTQARMEPGGMGMAKLRQRYQLECGQEPRVGVTGEYYEVQIPIIKKQLPKDEESTGHRG